MSTLHFRKHTKGTHEIRCHAVLSGDAADKFVLNDVNCMFVLAELLSTLNPDGTYDCEFVFRPCDQCIELQDRGTVPDESDA
jgi:hypothetical protein